ncbi:MAG TPA: PEGA domain-containing protein [Kofleriaceae bacterium]|nr:PEGA domain-containing protein [Kofleriaceae bacterium]
MLRPILRSITSAGASFAAPFAAPVAAPVSALVVALAATLAMAATAHAERIVAMAPLSTLGAEDTSAGTRKLTAQLEAAVAALPGTRVVRAAQVADAIRKARKPQLRACEGDAGCLAELASLVGAQIVISGEVGGLGDSRVVYLAATENGKELRSTTLAVSARDDGGADGGAAGAVVRLLDPDGYRGTLRFALDVTGATIYVNGAKITPSPRGEVSLPVGAQAVRVTHPHYHDFVRFIDVEFGKTTDVAVGMQQYPIIEHDVAGKPINRDRVEYIEPPLWRRWYVVGPAAVGLAILTAVVVGYAVHDFPDADCRKVGGGSC